MGTREGIEAFYDLTSCLIADRDDKSIIAEMDFVCAFVRRPAASFKSVQSPCLSDQWTLSAVNWISQNTDEALEIFVAGGQQTILPTISFFSDTTEWWPGVDPSIGFAKEIGRQLLGKPNFDCSLANPCTDDLVCTSIGSRIAFGFTHQVLPSFWGFFVVAPNNTLKSATPVTIPSN